MPLTKLTKPLCCILGVWSVSGQDSCAQRTKPLRSWSMLLTKPLRSCVTVAASPATSHDDGACDVGGARCSEEHVAEEHVACNSSVCEDGTKCRRFACSIAGENCMFHLTLLSNFSAHTRTLRPALGFVWHLMDFLCVVWRLIAFWLTAWVGVRCEVSSGDASGFVALVTLFNFHTRFLPICVCVCVFGLDCAVGLDFSASF